MSTDKNNIEVEPCEIIPHIMQDVYVNGKHIGCIYCPESSLTATIADNELNWEFNDDIVGIIGYDPGLYKVSDLLKLLKLHYDRN